LKVAATGGNATSPLQYDIIFEDISHSGDGGLYALLVHNLAFQGTTSYVACTVIEEANLSVTFTALISSSLLNSLLVQSGCCPGVRIQNLRWWGIKAKPQTYVRSFWALGVHYSNYTVTL